jgi:hypothetical protein
MSVELSPALITAIGGAIAAVAGGIATSAAVIVKAIKETGNHTATANADMLGGKLDDGFKRMGERFDALGNKIDEGNNKVVTAILSLKS